jgi:hypothetical protein
MAVSHAQEEAEKLIDTMGNGFSFCESVILFLCD